MSLALLRRDPELKVSGDPDSLGGVELAALRMQRDDLSTQLADVAGKLSRLNAAEAGQSSAQNALDALAAAELASWQEKEH